MSLEIISSEKFPKKAHNSPAVKIPGLVFCSGQVGSGSDVKVATKKALENLKEVLELAGAKMEQVCKYNSGSSWRRQLMIQSI